MEVSGDCSEGKGQAPDSPDLSKKKMVALEGVGAKC